jgi:hypothetical protein
VTDHPIIFSGPMVRAILDGRKTQTRRLVTVPWRGGRRVLPYEPYYAEKDGRLLWCDEYGDYHAMEPACPYGGPGDRLWVRETAYISPPHWTCAEASTHRDSEGAPRVVSYCAGLGPHGHVAAAEYGIRRTPSIHMPRWASRVTLEITGVRCERLQDICREDAMAEGWPGEGDPVAWFSGLWDTINGERAPWKSDPWVWVVSFARVEKAP